MNNRNKTIKLAHISYNYNIRRAIIYILVWCLLYIPMIVDGTYDTFTDSSTAVAATSLSGAFAELFIWLFFRIVIGLECRRSYLEYVNNAIDGEYYGLFLNKKRVLLPIEQVACIERSVNFFDWVNASNTLVIRTSAGKIKFQYVLDADESAQKIMKLVAKAKKDR